LTIARFFIYVYIHVLVGSGRQWLQRRRGTLSCWISSGESRSVFVETSHLYTKIYVMFDQGAVFMELAVSIVLMLTPFPLH
jgi:hypothetical protein